VRSTGKSWLLAIAAFLCAACEEQEPPYRYDAPHATFLADRPLDAGHDLVRVAESAISDAAAFLRIPPPERRPTLVVFASRRRLARFAAACCPALARNAAVCFERDGEFVLAVADGDRARTARLVRHELTHFVVVTHFGPLPPWLDEGLAQYLETGPPFGQGYPRLHKALRRAVRGRPDDVRLAELVSLPRPASLTDGQYAVAWGLVAYLLEAPGLGRDAVLRHARDLAAGKPAATSFAVCFGAPATELEPAWRTWTLGRLQQR
jgi:hypothetical protein